MTDSTTTNQTVSESSKNQRDDILLTDESYKTSKTPSPKKPTDKNQKTSEKEAVDETLHTSTPGTVTSDEVPLSLRGSQQQQHLHYQKND